MCVVVVVAVDKRNVRKKKKKTFDSDKWFILWSMHFKINLKINYHLIDNLPSLEIRKWQWFVKSLCQINWLIFVIRINRNFNYIPHKIKHFLFNLWNWRLTFFKFNASRCCSKKYLNNIWKTFEIIKHSLINHTFRQIMDVLIEIFHYQLYVSKRKQQDLIIVARAKLYD